MVCSESYGGNNTSFKVVNCCRCLSLKGGEGQASEVQLEAVGNDISVDKTVALVFVHNLRLRPCLQPKCDVQSGICYLERMRKRKVLRYVLLSATKMCCVLL